MDGRGEKLVADGSIVKLIIQPSSPHTPTPDWQKGSNAKFHYTVHAYVPEPETSPKNSEKHEHSGGCCSHGSKASNLEWIENIVNQAKGVLSKFVLSRETFENGYVLTLVAAESTHKTLQNQDYLGKPPIRRFIADSRQHDALNPFELRIGHDFSVKCMEICVKSMKPRERARFICFNEFVLGFVQLETALRKEKINALNAQKGLPALPDHMCGGHASPEYMSLVKELQDLEGAPLEFEIELLQVQSPNEYSKEHWEMTTVEKLIEAPLVKEQGNQMYKKGDIPGALAKYKRALILTESLEKSKEFMELKRQQLLQAKDGRAPWLQNQDVDMVTDTPGSSGPPTPIPRVKLTPALPSRPPSSQVKDNKMKLDDTLSLDIYTIEKLEITLRLNYAACQLKLKDYPPVIIQCTEVLNRYPRNVKALFRRGQAYFFLGRDLDLAAKDFNGMKAILQKSCKESSTEWKELVHMNKLLAHKLSLVNEKEKQMYSKIFK